MDTGESITIAHLVPQGATAYYNSAVEIDGQFVTPVWQGGSAPAAGNVSSKMFTHILLLKQVLQHLQF
jgi:hypothetical protein